MFTAAADAQLAAPPNDNYLSSTIIPQSATLSRVQVTYRDTEDTTEATTQADLFNPNQAGVADSGGGPEPLTCNHVSYGNTIWYDVHPKIPLGVELKASGFLNVIAVYEWSPRSSAITGEVGCQVSASATQTNDYIVPVELKKNHDYTVQLGGVQTAAGVASGSLAFAATFYPDHDGDGIYDPLDACPTLAGVQQAGGCPPRISPQVSYSYTGPSAGALSIKTFEITSVPGRARVVARCSCGVHQTVTAAAHASSVTLTSFIGASLPLGATIKIWTTKPAAGDGLYKYGAFGAYRKYAVTSGGLVAQMKRCLMPGSMTPRRECPAGGSQPHDLTSHHRR